jgi:hypothetical protein
MIPAISVRKILNFAKRNNLPNPTININSKDKSIIISFESIKYYADIELYEDGDILFCINTPNHMVCGDVEEQSDKLNGVLERMGLFWEYLYE